MLRNRALNHYQSFKRTLCFISTESELQFPHCTFSLQINIGKCVTSLYLEGSAHLEVFFPRFRNRILASGWHVALSVGLESKPLAQQHNLSFGCEYINNTEQ